MTPRQSSDNSSQWITIETLFHEALACEDRSPADYVDAQQGISAAVRAEVKSLLAALEKDRDLSQSERAGGEAQPTVRLPERFGPYRPQRLLGRGGMGVVYLATRDDGQFDQVVAVKTILSSFADSEFLRRFRTERQLLASLNHPHITRLLDGGVAASGEPYLVTEYVEGEAIDCYCDHHLLDIRARLRLFTQVCDAVGYAHRNLILHRDLKPSNIMVNGEGIVKLLDFGTAALMDGPEGGSITRTPLLTPRYASPEQLRGERASIAADVYSLGVVLYELLAGTAPFGTQISVVSEVSRACGDTSPKLLSAGVTEEAATARATSGERLRRQLEGDLEAIVGKALEGRDQARYQSVADMAADIGRYLDGNPVLARPQTAGYRLSKFLRRHWLPVATAAVVVAGLSASAIIAYHQAALTRTEAAKTEKLNEFLSEMLGSSSGSKFDPERFTVAQMLDAAEQRLQQRWNSDPLLEATLRRSLGESYSAIDRRQKAKDQLQRALEIFERYGEHQEAARVLQALEVNAMQDARYNDALALLDRAMVHLNALGSRAKPAHVFGVKYLYARLLGTFLQTRKTEAQSMLVEIIALARRDSSISRVSLAAAMNDLGGLLLGQGKTTEAEALFQEALTTGRKEAPGGRWESNALFWLQLIKSRQEQYPQAAEFARQRFEVLNKLLSSNNIDLQVVKADWARYRSLSGELVQAEQQIAEAMPIIHKSLPVPSFSAWSAYRAAATVMCQAGRLKEAEDYAREALAAVDAAHLAELDSRRAESLMGLGVVLQKQNRFGEARTALELSAQIYSQCGPAYVNAEKRVRKLLGAAVINRRPRPSTHAAASLLPMKDPFLW